MASVREIADMAKVSIGTVSRVVNGAPNIAPELRSRTLEAIRKLRYNTRTGDNRRMRQRTWNIGFAHLGTENELKENRFFVKSVRWLEQACSHYGYNLIVEILHGQDQVPRFVSGGKVDGIIFGERDGEMPIIPSGIPGCCIFSYMPQIPLPQVCSDDYGNAVVLVEQLLLRGLRRLVFVNPLPAHPGFRHRERGFCDAMYQHGLFRPELVIHTGTPLSHQHPTPLSEAVPILCRLPEFPEVIIVANDWQAVGMGLALEAAGIVPDRDVMLVGFDKLQLNPHLQWQYSTIAIPFAQVAQQAVQLLDNWISSGEPASGVRLLLGEFVPRGRMVEYALR